MTSDSDTSQDGPLIVRVLTRLDPITAALIAQGESQRGQPIEVQSGAAARFAIRTDHRTDDDDDDDGDGDGDERWMECDVWPE